MTGLDKANKINGYLTKPLPVNENGVDDSIFWVQYCIHLIDTGYINMKRESFYSPSPSIWGRRSTKGKNRDKLKLRTWLIENNVPHSLHESGKYDWAITLTDKNYFQTFIN